ncbi:AAA domain-containing protein [Carboxydochorda subterranea]|uniref:AAA domain-containing protein n=1 Tax=Carboxydichorda subterranea TaxID=3109565 RepID=A0ABZ1C182_9FIRM|nr:AAA domain-containing protein [Limnochorda sp. L945t]WRP18837.1 AAA domain-containing protein [Limnochorda sp. L945t]
MTASYHRILSALSDYFSLVSGAPAHRSTPILAREVAQLAPVLPLWMITNASVRRALPPEPGLFDLMVMDEASQCDPASAIPLLFRARRAAIIGDPHQLRHVAILLPEEEPLPARRQNTVCLKEHHRLLLRAAHRFQGDECDVLIFSPVVAQDLCPRSREASPGTSAGSRWPGSTSPDSGRTRAKARGSRHCPAWTRNGEQ